jgi:hypothetical protein
MDRCVLHEMIDVRRSDASHEMIDDTQVQLSSILLWWGSRISSGACCVRD